MIRLVRKLKDVTTEDVKQELCKMLKLKILPEIECAIKTRSNARRISNGCKLNTTTFKKSWTKYD